MSDQGTTLAAFVEDELEAERKRREALDQRGFEAVKIDRNGCNPSFWDWQR